MQDRSHGAEWNASIEDVLELDVAARDSIANDDKIGPWVEIPFGVWLINPNIQQSELLAHRRVGRGIGTGNTVSLKL